MNDNGGTVGVPLFNAGMRGEKVHGLGRRHAGGFVLALARHAQAGRRRPPGCAHRRLSHAGRTGRRQGPPEVGRRSSTAAVCAAAARSSRRLARPHAGDARRPLATGQGRCREVRQVPGPQSALQPASATARARHRPGSSSILQHRLRRVSQHRRREAENRRKRWRPIMTAGGRKCGPVWKTRMPSGRRKTPSEPCTASSSATPCPRAGKA